MDVRRAHRGIARRRWVRGLRDRERACITGARVEFLRDIQLTDRVMLSEPTLRIKTWAYVVWQTRGAAGLQFAQT